MCTVLRARQVAGGEVCLFGQDVCREGTSQRRDSAAHCCVYNGFWTTAELYGTKESFIQSQTLDARAQYLGVIAGFQAFMIGMI